MEQFDECYGKWKLPKYAFKKTKILFEGKGAFSSYKVSSYGESPLYFKKNQVEYNHLLSSAQIVRIVEQLDLWKVNIA